jgi:hypothetical protein
MSALNDEAHAELQKLIAQTLSLSATSRGYRLKGEREPLAAAVAALFATSFAYGVQWNPDKPDVFDMVDDREHAQDWKRDAGWQGPVVRKLTARLAGQDWEPDPEATA